MSEKEYIKRDAVKDLIERYGAEEDALTLIDSIHAADAAPVVRGIEAEPVFVTGLTVVTDAPPVEYAPVVRCEYCNKGHPELGMNGCVWCVRYSRDMNTDDFCSYGDRMVEDAAD